MEKTTLATPTHRANQIKARGGGREKVQHKTTKRKGNPSGNSVNNLSDKSARGVVVRPTRGKRKGGPNRGQEKDSSQAGSFGSAPGPPKGIKPHSGANHGRRQRKRVMLKDKRPGQKRLPPKQIRSIRSGHSKKRQSPSTWFSGAPSHD